MLGHWKIWGLGLLVVFGQVASAQVKMSLKEVWGAVQRESLGLQAHHADVEAGRLASDRAGRHWFPTLGLEAKSFYTDDPGAVLFSKLGEKNISGSDFSPAVMNSPDLARHEKITLGAKWMLFEGGAKLADSKALSSHLAAKTQGEQAAIVAEYSRTLGNYGALVILERKKEAIRPLKNVVEGTLQRYQIGQQSNPLGYSGLLGLKTLLQRINGEISMIEAQQKAVTEGLNVTAKIPTGWVPASSSLEQLFIQDVDTQVKELPGQSFAVQAQYHGASSALATADRERARFLPQVGLFAEQDFYSDQDSNSANSKTYGIFMQWQIFSASDYGAISQARAVARTFQLRAENEEREQVARLGQNKTAILALLEQIKLADESLRLLEEQTQVTRKLFTNGLINALQMTEVYSRCVDVIAARAQMEENVLKLKAESLNYQPYAIVK